MVPRYLDSPPCVPMCLDTETGRHLQGTDIEVSTSTVHGGAVELQLTYNRLVYCLSSLLCKYIESFQSLSGLAAASASASGRTQAHYLQVSQQTHYCNINTTTASSGLNGQ